MFRLISSLSHALAQTGSEGDTDGEDLHFGYYDNEEINCDEIAEEFLVLGVRSSSL